MKLRLIKKVITTETVAANIDGRSAKNLTRERTEKEKYSSSKILNKSPVEIGELIEKNKESAHSKTVEEVVIEIKDLDTNEVLWP